MMLKKPHFLSLAAGMLMANFLAHAQQHDFSFSQLSTNEGLSQSTVFSVLQDRQGFMWFGTRTGGLNKYDGYSFTYYKKDPTDPNSISGNEIVSLFEDSKGIIWAGTRNDGLSRFDPETETFYPYYSDPQDPATIPNNTVLAVCEDGLGTIWVGTNSGVCKYNAGSNNFTRVTQSGTDASYGQVLDVITAGEGRVVIATKNSGVFVLEAATERAIAHFEHDEAEPTSLNTNYITALLYDSQGRLWAGSRKHGLNMSEDLGASRFQHFTANPDDPTSIASNIIRTLHEDEDGNIWVGTKSGLDKVSAASLKSGRLEFVHFQNDPANTNSLSQNSVYSFARDQEGNFWVGTWSGGVNYINKAGHKFEWIHQHVGQEDGLNNNAVSSFARTAAGLWVGTEGGGLNLYRESSRSFTHFTQNENVPGSLRSNHIKSLYVDAAGDLWVGTFNGLHLYDPNTNTFRHFLKGNSIYTLEGANKGGIWVGSGAGLYLLNKDDFSMRKYRHDSGEKGSLSNDAINRLFRDSRGRLWVGTKNGLNRYHPESDSFERFTHSRDDITTISNNFISAIGEDATGAIWIGTVDGLNQFKEADGSFVHVGENEGIPDNVINNILSDGAGNLWFTTNKGLTRFHPEQQAAGKADSLFAESSHLKTYNVTDGLQGNEFFMNASYQDASGRFYLGGAKGFNSFAPGELRENTHVPKVVISGFKLFNKPVPIGGEGSPLTRHISQTTDLELTHEQSFFTFQFVALNYNSPEKNQYAYMLEGLDQDWNFTGNRQEVSYTNLPPGEYVFRVIASNNDGKWNREGASLNLTILAPWWQTTWFYISVAGAILLLTLIGIRLRVRKLKRDRKVLQTQLEEGRAELAAEQERVQKQEEELRLRDENERDMKWYNRGFIDLSNIISENRDDLDTLSKLFLGTLVKYVDAQMGAVYLAEEEHEEQWLELWAAYAPDSRRTKGSRVEMKNGLVGECFHQKRVFRIDELPEGYARFSSGLGDAELKHLVIVPVLFEERAEGVIELVSLDKLEDVKVRLIENISNHLAALLINRKANQKIEEMLAATAAQKEELSAQEEELRQNLEEMTATQEESSRREKELLQEIDQLRKLAGPT